MGVNVQQLWLTLQLCVQQHSAIENVKDVILTNADNPRYFINFIEIHCWKKK